MEKNTIIAIVLSALVLFVSLFVQTTYCAPKQQQTVQNENSETQQVEQVTVNSESETSAENEESEEKEILQEEILSIKTDKVKVTFTSKGGDVISYKILDHLDKDVRLKGEDREEFNKLVTLLYSADNGKDFNKVLLDEDTSKDKDKISSVVIELERVTKEISEAKIVDEKIINLVSVLREMLSVEMVDNVTDSNRAFGLSFGDSSQSIRNEIFKVKKFDDNPYKIGFYYQDYEMNDGGKIKKLNLFKTYTFDKSDYVFKLEVRVGSENGFSVGDKSYTIRTSPQIGPYYDQKNSRYDVRQYVAYTGSKSINKNVESKTYDKAYEWAGIAGKYFTLLVKPATPTSMQPITVTKDNEVKGYKNSQLFLTRNAIDSNNVNDIYFVYVGPRSEAELSKYNKAEKNAWGLNETKFTEALQTSGFLNWLEVILKWALEKINSLVINWGVSIIILTIILKVLLFPINRKTSMGSVKMQEIQPKLKELQERYKGNPQQLQLETSKLYKQVGYNPVSGCLPMIFQMIILFALYNVFNNYFEFRGAKFIAGWIDDLSVGDSVYRFNGNISVITWFTMNNIRILPFIYAISQIISGTLTQLGTNAQGKQMKFMTYGLPLFFFFLFYNVPSGLLLYWTTSNILQMFQQLIINNMMKKKRLELESKKPAVNANVLKFKGGKKKTR